VFFVFKRLSRFYGHHQDYTSEKSTYLSPLT